MTEGINIPREVADAEGVPDDLDANVVGPYRFPDPRRRRIAGWIYLAVAAVLAIAAVTWLSGLWVMAAIVAALGTWHMVSAWPLEVEQEQALHIAATAVGFPVGHASAAMTFHGPRARPRWHVIVYSADEPPSRRALVEVDAVSGEQIREPYTETIPAD